METLTPILVYISLFLLVLLIATSLSYSIKNWNYSFFVITETRVSFDIILGEISWDDKAHYRRHKKSMVWQRRVERMVVRKPVIGKGKLRTVYEWKNVSAYKNRKLEKMIRG